MIRNRSIWLPCKAYSDYTISFQLQLTDLLTFISLLVNSYSLRAVSRSISTFLKTCTCGIKSVQYGVPDNSHKSCFKLLHLPCKTTGFCSCVNVVAIICRYVY